MRIGLGPSQLALVLALTFAFGLCVCFAQNGYCASFNVNPIGFNLAPQRPSGVMQITNTGDAAVRLQVSAMDWGSDGRKETLADTDDLLLNPPIFSVAPGQTQYLRFGLRQPAKTADEKAYRLLVEEVPAAGPQPTGLRTLLRISIPVFIDPKEKRQKFSWQLRRNASGTVLVALNEGNVHTKIHSIKLSGADSGKELIIGTPAYILPGQHKEWLLEKGKIQTGKVRLKIQTDKGEGEENLMLEAD